jgi:hypothetical protein
MLYGVKFVIYINPVLNINDTNKYNSHMSVSFHFTHMYCL